MKPSNSSMSVFVFKIRVTKMSKLFTLVIAMPLYVAPTYICTIEKVYYVKGPSPVLYSPACVARPT